MTTDEVKARKAKEAEATQQKATRKLPSLKRAGDDVPAPPAPKKK